MNFLIKALILTTLLITSTLATEIIYLTDCVQDITFPNGTSQTNLQSIMVYYRNASTSLGQIPTLSQIGNILDPTGTPIQEFTRWEVWQDLPDNSQEQHVTATFPDGNHVKAFINAEASSWPTDTVVGNAWNDWGKGFTCRKDDQNGHKTLFQDFQPFSENICYLRYRCEA
ncbi:hypothetical protein HDU97_003767 [Phlyctochytrium planicorne]|nr:hypothetical protein HDU97_003767 [Phlyctochytrium planicorne]